MQVPDISLRTYLTAVLFLITAAFSTHSFALSTHTLTSNTWSQISIPADPGSTGTVQTLLGDDLPAESYGASGSWVIYEYNAAQDSFRALALSDPFVANVSYWIIQTVADSVELDLPDTLKPLAGQVIPGCPADTSCAAHALVGSADGKKWNLAGASLDSGLSFGESRFQTSNSACSDGCNPEQAIAEGLIGASYHFNGTGYDVVTEATVLAPWDGIWIDVLADNPAVSWILPVAAVAPPPPPPPNPDPEPVVVSAEIDMIRLLMQGSFGPTEADIANGLELGGPAAWIDAQMALPAEQHLPIVKELFPDEKDRQRGRYQAFWERSLRADDQLRQRVAFALSQIFVVSDKAGPLHEVGNQVAAYYDVLVNNAFGNYRQLLEDVTLNPAMGRYLSMLGNDKPNSETGLRADENYAREMMQLFSIGLVGLNIDGTERAGEVTYTQPDVENLSRALTGWYWDVEEWRSYSTYRPQDFDILEQPMIAFADHHDTDEKVFMGNTIPAGQTAEQDLAMVLDILFNHPNVGPFIGEQLIKRLVTSNPSPAYISRVASAFNDDGTGVRGDMSAVIKAVLLDDEARNTATSNRTDFGKLREPLLRYAHLWRAFDVTGTFDISIYTTTVVPQIAPLTAHSVFNFYSPSHAPQGTIADAGLVAPEFQINSEATSNNVNATLMRAVVKDEMRGESYPLNLTREAQLLESSAVELIDHLDRLLTAGRLTAGSREILTEYIDSNRERVEADRLLRDVIGLVVTSTEFAIQR